jgi:hypothetical protein
MIDREFESRLGQSKNCDIGICYFSAKHTLLRSNIKDWLVLNQDNILTVSYHYTNSTTRVGLVQYGHYNHFTECIFLAMIYIGNCSSSVNQQSINHWTRKQLGSPFCRCLLCWNIYIYKTFFEIWKVAISFRDFIKLDIDKVPRWDDNFVILRSV